MNWLVNIVPYVKIARPDHWFKNVFMLPGAALAVLLSHQGFAYHVSATLLALLCLCLLASANYSINEWLDAESDRFHPVKSQRPSVSGDVKFSCVMAQYGLLQLLGLGIAWQMSTAFFSVALVFSVMGLVYNVKPLRSKDRPYLDVLTEALNNPLRLLMGWTAILPDSLPPSSILLAYWMGGAFLMAVKRYAEFRFLGDPARASLYRKSFALYNEQSLLLSSFFYALCSSFFLAIFLIKYRIEFLLTFPLFAGLFMWYLALGMQHDSPAQRPEKLLAQSAFVAYVFLLVALVGILFYVDIPLLHILVEPIRYR